MTPETSALHRLALGIDAGGTETRWALAGPDGGILAEGRLEGFSALELNGEGRERVLRLLEELAAAVLAVGRPARLHAGMTGFTGEDPDFAQLLAEPFGLPLDAVTLGSDLETAYLALFKPGEGYLVYAGTGSVAAFVDEAGELHRAGGRGSIIDDAGGGHWIAREALRRVWRAEDECPGAWRESPLALSLFEAMGGPDWTRTRQYVYGGSRGEVGRLALAVAACADRDTAAADIMMAAGTELARLGQALIGRYGPRPVTLSGRAATLHPLIAESLQMGLPERIPFAHHPCEPHQAAARLALAALRPPSSEVQP